MSTKKYSTEFKKTIVNLYRSGKSYSQIHTEYGISTSALSNWIKMYSEVKIDDETIITAQQIKELQKRNALLEEENLILKKVLRKKMCKQYLTKLATAKITGINLLQIVNNIIGFYPKTGYGNAEEQPERYWGFYTETGGELIARFARFRKKPMR